MGKKNFKALQNLNNYSSFVLDLAGHRIGLKIFSENFLHPSSIAV